MGIRYDLSRLGSQNFEHMVQSLIKGVESSTIICGEGRDDQREFYIRNADFQVLNGNYAHGYTVGQAKFKSDDKTKDVTWVKSQLKKELDGFIEKQGTEPEKVPETYLFFTNVVLSPVKGGGRDQVEKYIEKYRELIPNICIFAADDIRTLLENNRDVARCYTSFILPGDVLAELQGYLEALKNKNLCVLIEYALQMFEEDGAVRLDQAGSISEKAIQIGNVYTDLEVMDGENGEKENKRIAETIISLGDICQKREKKYEDEGLWEQDRRLRQRKSSRFVIIGNAGQGKSTVCQYICQIYRAYFLKRLHIKKNSGNSFLDFIQHQHISSPLCERFPIMISLKRYAAWINKQEDDDLISVSGYIISLIRKRTGVHLSIPDFKQLLSGYSWIFFFDGLDEVPVSSNRTEVLRQINNFMRIDIAETCCDSVVVCTSRPQGYDNAFSNRYFKHYELIEMSKSLCKEYLKQLLSYLEENIELREQYQCTLWEALDDPTVSKLMTTPLYTAIIALLIKAGGTAPKKRYKLFKEYCRVVITREKQKKLLPFVNQDSDWVEELHDRIAFNLQLESESSAKVDAEMLASECKEIIKSYLSKEEEELTTVDEIYQAMVARLPFIAEVIGESGEKCILFPLRSIQEFFAAEWLIDFSNDDTRRDALEIISVSSYWRNVYLFVNGCYATRDKHRVMNDAMFCICEQNNGDGVDELSDSFAQMSSLQGSWLALDVLQDEPYNHPKAWRRYAELASKILNSPAASRRAIKRFLDLPLTYEEWFLRNKIFPIVRENLYTEQTAFFLLWGMADRGNKEAYDCLESLCDSIVLSGTYHAEWLLKLGYKGVGKVALNKLFRWVTNDCFVNFCNPLKAEIEYWEFLNYCISNIDSEEVMRLSLRQACYRLMNGYYSPQKTITETIGEYWMITGLDVFINQRTSSFHSPIRVEDVNCNLLYYPIDRWICAKKYLKYFQEHDLTELVALANFYEDFSYLNLTKLINVCKGMTEKERIGFFSLREWSHNWLLKTIANQFPNNLSIKNVLEYNEEFISESLIKSDRIVELVISSDIVGLTESNLWDYIILRKAGSTRRLDEKTALKILKYSEENLMSKAFIGFISKSIFSRKNLSLELREWGRQHLRYLLNFNGGKKSAYRLLDQTEVVDLMRADISFPNKFPLDGFNMPRVEKQLDLINRLFRFAEFQERLLEAYSLIPFGFRRYNKECLISFLPKNDALSAYKKIEEINNPIAIFGFTLCILATDSIMPELRMSLFKNISYFMNYEETYSTWLTGIRLFSLEGKKIILKVTEKMGEKVKGIRGYCIQAILEELEGRPINQDRLLYLSKEGHLLT